MPGHSDSSFRNHDVRSRPMCFRRVRHWTSTSEVRLLRLPPGHLTCLRGVRQYFVFTLGSSHEMTESLTSVLYTEKYSSCRCIKYHREHSELRILTSLSVVTEAAIKVLRADSLNYYSRVLSIVSRQTHFHTITQHDHPKDSLSMTMFSDSLMKYWACGASVQSRLR